MKAELLAAYDRDLRGAVELRNAVWAEVLGPVHLGVFPGGFGFVSHGRLDEAAGGALPALVGPALDRLRADPGVRLIEWKTRAHDRLPGLEAALRAEGFRPAEPESIMIGEAALLAQDLPLPDGVRLRAVTAPEDVRAASAMADEVFGEAVSDAVSAERAADLLVRIAAGAELWVAEEDGEVVCCGRLEPLTGTAFAGLWGGATRESHRHRGIYRALTGARACSALRRGVRYLNSDSTEHSRPILERSGLTKVSTTTPWEWRR